MSIIIPPAPAYPPNIYNYSPNNLKNWRKALARVRTGAGNARILCVGDSTTFGYGGTAGSNIPPTAYPAALSGLFGKAGFNSHWNSWIGIGSLSSVNYQNDDSRLVIGNSWTTNTYPVFVPNGYPCKNTAATNAISFTPTVNVDTFKIWYISGNTGTSNYGSFTANINGGTNTTTATNTGTSGIGTTTITGTLGSNTCNVSWSANGPVYIIGMEAYDSSKSWVSVINAGWVSASSSTWTITADNFGPNKGLALMGQDLTIINLGINDWQGGAAGSTYTTNMQSLITNALGSGGDVILMTPNPSNTSSASTANQNTYITAMYQLAAANNLVLVDNYTRWGSYTASNALSFNFDSLHPNAAGYSDLTQNIMRVIGAP